MDNDTAYQDENEQPEQQVRRILVLPRQATTITGNDESIGVAIRELTAFISSKVNEYKQALSQNSPAVFTVNYVQNRFVCSEISVELSRFWEKLAVTNRNEYLEALDVHRTTDPDSVDSFQEKVDEFNSILSHVDHHLDEQLGSDCSLGSPRNRDEIPGLRSQTIRHLVSSSPFDLVLVVVVHAFKDKVNNYIVDLHTKIKEFHNHGTDIILLMRGPPVGQRGGGYIKLIGVPFRKMFDEEEAINELKAHRQSALRVAGWDAICDTVEAAMSDDCAIDDDGEDDSRYFIQRGGTILLDQKGTVLFKQIENDGIPLPTADIIFQKIKDRPISVEPGPIEKEKSLNSPKVSKDNSKDYVEVKEKKCCIIS